MSSGEVQVAVEKNSDFTGSRVGMWLFLFTELLFFGGLFLLYAVFRATHPEEFHRAAHDLSITHGFSNVIILLTSSLTMVLSITALQKKDKRASKIFLIVTIILGFAFLVNKFFEWSEKIGHGIYPNSPELLQRGAGETLFYGLYYVMTGLHSLHVIGGVFVLSIMFIFLENGTINGDDYVKLENTGLYWHFVDIIWIFLFPLFYLIT
ncbi:MAG: cytochrome c oxidase subunit 3 [Candidatus Schekmanbacteria bacterium]|nr:cytochrome c oxidase subunit 3 [Candidatus Schekmanbacteria bacterium]